MSKITKKGNHIFVPDHVTIPYIEGDGVGHEITTVSQKIVNAAIKQAYNGTRSIEWKEVLAGEKAFKQTGSWLPDETMEAFREYIVGIKGPLTTPIGGGIKCGPPSDVGFICLSPSGSLVQRSRISGKGAAESEYVYLP